MNAHDPKQKKVNDRDKFNFRNVYHDSYNDSLGQYLYTGEGQKGDQTFSFGNKGLADAKKMVRKFISFVNTYLDQIISILVKLKFLDLNMIHKRILLVNKGG